MTIQLTLLTAAVAAAVLAASAAPAAAQAPAPLPVINDATPLFCRDEQGEIKPIPYVTMGTVVRKFAERYHFNLLVQPKPLVLMFANPGETEYYIRYQADYYKDIYGHQGVVLESAHVSLANTDNEFKGTGMCFFTAFGK